MSHQESGNAKPELVIKAGGSGGTPEYGWLETSRGEVRKEVTIGAFKSLLVVILLKNVWDDDISGPSINATLNSLEEKLTSILLVIRQIIFE